MGSKSSREKKKHERDPSEPVKVVFVGSEGVGKSTLLLTWVCFKIDNNNNNNNNNNNKQTSKQTNKQTNKQTISLLFIIYLFCIIYNFIYNLLPIEVSFENISSRWVPQVSHFCPYNSFIPSCSQKGSLWYYFSLFLFFSFCFFSFSEVSHHCPDTSCPQKGAIF